ncbi:MAG: hypothetical protein SGBAC_011327 [Bacillariaceae sp.]
MSAPRTLPRTAPLAARLASPSAPSSSRNTSFSTQNAKKSKAEILEVKRKAISLLTTAYKADNDEKVDELEAQLKDLLHLIRPAEDFHSTTKTDSATTVASSTTSSTHQERKNRPISMPSPPSTAASTSPVPGILLRDFNGRTKPNPIQAHIGEIRKPMKQFHAHTATIEPIKNKKGVVAGMQQEAFLEAAMGRSRVKENAGWMGFLFGPGDDDSETGFKEFGEMGGKGLRKKQKARRRAAKRSSGDSASDAFAGMIVTTSSSSSSSSSSSKNGTNKSVGSSQASSISSGSFDSEDDVSTLGTESTYESASERMAGLLRVRRLPTTAEEEDETSPEGGETNGKDAVVLQDIAEEESPAAADMETPVWRWFQPRVQVPA